METRKDVEAEYTVDEWGTIRSPGKFEGESWIAPIVYEWVMDGGDERVYPDCECGEDDLCECPSTSIFVLAPEDHKALDLKSDTYALTLDESEQGFVYIGELTRAEYEKAIAS